MHFFCGLKSGLRKLVSFWDVCVGIAVREFARMLKWLGNLRSLCGSCNSLDVHTHKSSRYVSVVSEVHNANTPCYTPCCWQYPIMKIDALTLTITTALRIGIRITLIFLLICLGNTMKIDALTLTITIALRIRITITLILLVIPPGIPIDEASFAVPTIIHHQMLCLICGNHILHTISWIVGMIHYMLSWNAATHRVKRYSRLSLV